MPMLVMLSRRVLRDQLGRVLVGLIMMNKVLSP
jgi:hypothetical protein